MKGRALATKSDHLNSVPKTHQVEERADSCKLSSDPYICAVACAPPPNK